MSRILLAMIALAVLVAADPTMVPLSPEGLTYERPSDDTVNLSWSKPFDPDGRGVTDYTIYRAKLVPGQEPDFAAIDQILAIAEPTYEDHGVVAGGHYAYFVTGVNAHGEGLPSVPVYVGDYPHCPPVGILLMPPAVDPNLSCLLPPPGP